MLPNLCGCKIGKLQFWSKYMPANVMSCYYFLKEGKAGVDGEMLSLQYICNTYT